MLDFATLTGAARVALGTEVPAMFCNDDALARRLAGRVQTRARPRVEIAACTTLSRADSRAKLPTSRTASRTPFGGAITAALFFETFVPDTTPWAHFDTMAWNLRAKPGRAEGGEAMGLRGVFRYLRERFEV